MKFLAVFPIVFLFSVQIVFGQDGEACRYPHDPTVSNSETYKGFDRVVILDSISVSVMPTGSGEFAVYQAFKVLTDQGALKSRIIKYDYDPLTAFAAFSYAKIYKADGEIINLDVSKAFDYAAPARAIYWGARQIMLETGKLDIGDVVEYEIVKKGFTYALLANQMDDDEARFIPPMRGHFYDIVPFWVDDPTVRKIYSVSLPMEKELQFLCRATRYVELLTCRHLLSMSYSHYYTFQLYITFLFS